MQCGVSTWCDYDPDLRIYDSCPTNLNYLFLIDILEIAAPYYFFNDKDFINGSSPKVSKGQ
jgi:hypothetical protein